MLIKIILPAAALIFSSGISQAADPAAGRKLFEAKCASCHGKDAKGNAAMAKMFKAEPAALNLIDEDTLKKTDADLSDVTDKGRGKMPSYKGKLKPEEISDVLAYLRTLGGAAPTAAPSASPSAVDASALYLKSCASCHGKDGKGSPAMAKMFKLDNAALDLVDKASLAKSDAELSRLTAEGAGKMPAYKTKLQSSEIGALTVYIRSLGPKKE